MIAAQKHIREFADAIADKNEIGKAIAFVAIDDKHPVNILAQPDGLHRRPAREMAARGPRPDIDHAPRQSPVLGRRRR